MRLQKLHIFGIFERQDIAFDFDQRPFFLVGPNGTGKSTALKILHSILTAQWDRLQSFSFAGIDITIDGTIYNFDRSDFARISRLRSLSPRRNRRSKKPLNLLPYDWLEFSDDVTRYLGRTRSSATSSSALNELSNNYNSLALINNFVELESKGHVLYFPTYRRVERDLKELLEDADDLSDEWENEVSLAPNIVDRFHSTGEVVGFGGQDIGRLLLETSARIERDARQALNEHSILFLKNISTDSKVDTRVVKTLIKSKDKISNFIKRISLFSPSTVDLSAVVSSIEQLGEKIASGGRGRLNQREDALLTYLSELIKLLDRVDQLSYPLRMFSQLVTHYFKPTKRAELRDFDNKVVIYDINDNEIQPDQLSSGEKQILSFFAFLLLRDTEEKRFIIIDEPELSLSVSWQKSLIKDLSILSPNSYVVAATHSPFIFSSFGLDYVHSLGEL